MFCKYCGKKLAENVIFCSQCGKKLDVTQAPKTVENPVNEKKYCEQCGTQNEKTAKFCLSCGASMIPGQESVKKETVNNEPKPASFTPVTTNAETKNFTPTDSTKSRTVAALLAFFFGEIGAHRFYVGKTGSAVVQMLLGLSFIISLFTMAADFFEAGVFFLLLGIGWCFWTLIDFIMILCGSFRDKDNLLITNWDF